MNISIDEYNTMKQEIDELKKKNEELESRLKTYTSNHRHKKYYDNNTEIVKTFAFDQNSQRLYIGGDFTTLLKVDNTGDIYKNLCYFDFINNSYGNRTNNSNSSTIEWHSTLHISH